LVYALLSLFRGDAGLSRNGFLLALEFLQQLRHALGVLFSMEGLVDVRQLKVIALADETGRRFAETFLQPLGGLLGVSALGQAQTQIIVDWRCNRLRLGRLPQQRYPLLRIACLHLNLAQVIKRNRIVGGQLQFRR
jgi:hypothetical protein